MINVVVIDSNIQSRELLKNNLNSIENINVVKCYEKFDDNINFENINLVVFDVNSSTANETLEKVVAARNIAAGATSPEARIEAEKNLTSSLRTFLNVVSESYPDLKANTNFLDLQNQLKQIEGELESSRRYYNGMVKSFNTMIEVFPSSIVASRKGSEYTKKPYFELDSAEERKNVKVSF